LCCRTAVWDPVSVTVPVSVSVLSGVALALVLVVVWSLPLVLPLLRRKERT
jgi:hypothetical protein